MKLWDLTSNGGIRSFHLAKPSLDLKAISNAATAKAPPVRWVGGVAFRPDGAQLAAAGTDETVALWSFASGKLERTLETPDRIRFRADI